MRMQPRFCDPKIKFAVARCTVLQNRGTWDARKDLQIVANVIDWKLSQTSVSETCHKRPYLKSVTNVRTWNLSQTSLTESCHKRPYLKAVTNVHIWKCMANEWRTHMHSCTHPHADMSIMSWHHITYICVILGLCMQGPLHSFSLWPSSMLHTLCLQYIHTLTWALSRDGHHHCMSAWWIYIHYICDIHYICATYIRWPGHVRHA